MIKKILVLLTVSFSFLFAIGGFKANVKDKINLPLKNKEQYIKRINWEGKSPIFLNIAFQIPTKVVFPGFIEKLEYLDGQAGITIVQQDLIKGTQSLVITRKYDIHQDGIAYVTVLGKRIPLVLKYVSPRKADFLVYVNFGFMKNPETSAKKKQNIFKVITHKNLTQKTNLKSVSMIVHMINGDAGEYYKEIPLKLNIKNNFFNAKDMTQEQYQALLFKKVFNGNKDFMTAYFNNEIIPEKMYLDNYMVYITDKNKKDLNIIGVKMKWCNLSNTYYKQINIDDIKVVIGKTLLAAYHPFKKIPPKACVNVYAVFYTFGKLKKY